MAHVIEAGNAPSFWFMGMRGTILSRGGERAPTTVELVLPPGGVTPLHLHEDDEDSGIVLEGSVKTWCDGELIDVVAGTWASLPRGRPHAQLVTSGTAARVIAVYSNSHFADFIAEVGLPADRTPPPPGPPPPSEMLRAREIAARHRLQVLGPAPPELLAFRRVP
jgi:quercetin dioxygenase-like cupin family protein